MPENSVLISTEAISGTNTGTSVSYTEVHTTAHGRIPTNMPPTVNVGQAYYWKYAWQAATQESREDIAAGRTRVFPNGEETIRWLLSDED